MPTTEAIKSLMDLSGLDGVSLASPYPLACNSRDGEMGPLSCMVCMATYLNTHQSLKIIRRFKGECNSQERARGE